MVNGTKYSQNALRRLMMEDKYDFIYKDRKKKAREYYKRLKDSDNIKRFELVKFILNHPNDENNYQIKKMMRDKYVL